MIDGNFGAVVATVDGVEKTAAITLQSRKMQKIMKSMYIYFFMTERYISLSRVENLFSFVSTTSGVDTVYVGIPPPPAPLIAVVDLWESMTITMLSTPPPPPSPLLGT